MVNLNLTANTSGARSIIVSQMFTRPLATEDEMSSRAMIFAIISSQKSFNIVPIVLL